MIASAPALAGLPGPGHCTGAGGKGEGKLGEILFLIFSPRDSLFNVLPQV